MTLEEVTIELDEESFRKMEILKKSGVDVDKMFNDNLEAHLGLAGNEEFLKKRLLEIRKKIKLLTIQESIISKKLKSLGTQTDTQP